MHLALAASEFSTAVPAVFRRCFQERIMTMNKDQVKGRVTEAEGKIQEVAGKVVGDKSLEAKGNLKSHLGQLQKKIGDVKDDLKDSKAGARR
jgi:uncharacterized protein YjbJ (UPF0337 family)